MKRGIKIVVGGVGLGVLFAVLKGWTIATPETSQVIQRADERGSALQASRAEEQNVTTSASVHPIPSQQRTPPANAGANVDVGRPALPQDEPAELVASSDLSSAEEANLIRKPVIDAIRMIDVAGAAKFEKVRAALHASGESAEAWTRQATEVFGDWVNQVAGQGNALLDSSSTRCYLAACESLVYFETERAYQETAVVFRSVSESNAAHGGRVQTPVKRLDDGRWVAAWLMMRPDVPVE